MKVDLTDIVSAGNKCVTKEVQLSLTSFDSKLGSFPIIKKTPFTLRLTNEDNERLLIEAETDVTVEIPCGRCLEPVDTDFHIEARRELSLPAGGDERDEDGSDDCVDGLDLDVDRLICHEIMADWPMRVLCREDCKGICKTCGANLNKETCGCEKTEPDPRMAAVRDIFNKFKEV